MLEVSAKAKQGQSAIRAHYPIEGSIQMLEIIAKAKQGQSALRVRYPIEDETLKATVGVTDITFCREMPTTPPSENPVFIDTSIFFEA